ncbi:response regulator [Alkalimonas amylolytica]|uniref:Response regulator receiver protein n=1 Tax=Alkalimonas amylolytica TaxID=152573 RepID=A0A1H4B3B9_ALKAM|nr:response regulator [Alkalimonas amylolytica]SEA42392.1 response regulator receiver protein [Alkalimonas amylolytica]
MDKADLSNLEALKVLIVDDQYLVHNLLKEAFDELGIRQIKYAENAYYALRLCEQHRFHIVICAFNVKSDKDGFHLLEELKFKGYVNKRTVLIFLSAETDESLVNSIVELQPDDFWVKPLDRARVKQRLPQVLNIKRTLFDVYEAIDLKNYSKAIYQVDRHLLNPKLSRFYLQLLRMKGDALLKLQEFEEAERFYLELRQKHQMSWVHLGYVNALLKQDKMQQIEELLAEMTDRVDTRFATYDLLAQYHIERQDFDRAYDEIKKAVALAPRNIERNKKVWDLARLTHDFEGQYLATQAMAKHAKNSLHDSPVLALNVIRAGLDLAQTLNNERSHKILQQTDRHIQALEKDYKDAALFKEQITIAKARLLLANDERKKAENLIDLHVSVRPIVSLDDNLDKAKIFHELGRREEAALIMDAVKKQISSDNLAGMVVKKYVEQECDEQERVHFTPKQLQSMAVEFFKKKKYGAALTALEQAMELTPKNNKIPISVLKVLALMFEEGGLSASQKELALRTVSLLTKNQLTDEELQSVAQYKERLNLVLAQAMLPME